MKKKYKDWISEVTETYGTCAEVTLEMVAEFPELTRVRGHYYCPFWGEREHWWLKDGEEVIDPTFAQFPSKGAGEYVEWEEGQQEPTGMCTNCGEYCYDGGTCCSESCHNSYVAYCMNPY